jgi:hypothetical protein
MADMEVVVAMFALANAAAMADEATVVATTSVIAMAAVVNAAATTDEAAVVAMAVVER